MALPLGKLPADLLARLLSSLPQADPRVLYGPGVGRDCAVINLGEHVLVMKSDPITFASEEIGWYAVQINANDLATTGATPHWMLATLLLPPNTLTEQVERIFQQLKDATTSLGITLVGGHTEITHGIDHPILMGTLLGEVERHKLILPSGAQPGDTLLLTKGIPIEATALLAREFAEQLGKFLTIEELEEARQYLFHPGISVVRDAALAVAAGRVHAMHDPTEGGLASALWELAEASNTHLVIQPEMIPISTLSAKICAAFQLDPIATIASGALLMAVDHADAPAICCALQAEGIPCEKIGQVQAGEMTVSQTDGALLPRPARDEITKVYEIAAS